MFNIFRRKDRAEKKSAIASYNDFPSLWGGDAVAGSDIVVTPITAMQCSAVLACVRTLANGVAQVPFRLYRQTGKVRVPATEHPLYDLTYMAPSEFQTSFEFFHMIMLHLTLTGNAFVWVNRAPDGRILELLPYPPGRYGPLSARRSRKRGRRALFSARYRRHHDI